MRRLNTYMLDDRGFFLFNMEDVVTLLAHEREEAFKGERAVRLFQFRTWILFPGRNEGNAAKWAELIAAVKYLDLIEEDYFADEEMGRQYREDDRTGIDLSHKPPQTFHRMDQLNRYMTN